MKKVLLILLVLGGIVPVWAKETPLKLIYSKPAASVNEAVPVGNGRLGALVYGGIRSEKISLNDDTFWSGEPREWNNPAAPLIIPQIHQALLDGNHPLADQLAQKIQGPYNESYQPLAELDLQFDHGEAVENYSRTLDLRTALSTVSYRVDGTRYTRTAFVSYPDQVLVIELTADGPAKLNFNLKLDGKHQRSTRVTDAGWLEANGKAPAHVDPSYLDTPNPVIHADNDAGKGMRYSCLVRVEQTGGEQIRETGALRVKQAEKAIIYLTARTSFSGFDRSPSAQGLDCTKLAGDDMQTVATKPYAQLLKAHAGDYSALFNRLHFNLGEAPDSATPMETLVADYRTGKSQKLAELVFQMGRYLIIAGSRPGSQPLNLQGIWNEWVRPPWSSNYTLNINAQMNYWPVLASNLAECHEPQLRMIEELAVNGHQTARVNYNCGGWLAHHNTDLWRQSSPVGDGSGEPSWANFTGGGIWMSFDFWEHFQYTQDQVFLKERVYPLLKGAVEFSLDWLKKDSSGHLLPPFTVSSEATYITPDGYKGYTSRNTGQDIALYGELFVNFMKTCQLTGQTDELYRRVEQALGQLAPYEIDPEGKIKEWLEEGIDRPVGGNKNHLSQLIGFFPGRHLIDQNDPDLVRAVRRTLEIFGPSTAGWMHAWEISLWARLRDAQMAYDLVKRLTDRFGANTFNPDGAYQIDWQMGYTAGICEMLLQSHLTDRQGNPQLALLPALPAEWATGSVDGLRARGGFEVGMTWHDGRLKTATVKNLNPKMSTLTILVNGKAEQIKLAAGKTWSLKE